MRATDACFAVVLTSMVILGCSSSPKPQCGPDTCGGCCGDDQFCHPGDQSTACGQHGTACNACGSSEACVAGVCAIDGDGGGGGSAVGGGGGGISSGGGVGGGPGGGEGGGAGGSGGSGGGGIPLPDAGPISCPPDCASGSVCLNGFCQPLDDLTLDEQAALLTVTVTSDGGPPLTNCDLGEPVYAIDLRDPDAGTLVSGFIEGGCSMTPLSFERYLTPNTTWHVTATGTAEGNIPPGPVDFGDVSVGTGATLALDFATVQVKGQVLVNGNYTCSFTGLRIGNLTFQSLTTGTVFQSTFDCVNHAAPKYVVNLPIDSYRVWIQSQTGLNEALPDAPGLSPQTLTVTAAGTQDLSFTTNLVPVSFTLEGMVPIDDCANRDPSETKLVAHFESADVEAGYSDLSMSCGTAGYSTNVWLAPGNYRVSVWGWIGNLPAVAVSSLVTVTGSNPVTVDSHGVPVSGTVSLNGVTPACPSYPIALLSLPAVQDSYGKFELGCDGGVTFSGWLPPNQTVRLQLPDGVFPNLDQSWVTTLNTGTGPLVVPIDITTAALTVELNTNGAPPAVRFCDAQFGMETMATVELDPVNGTGTYGWWTYDCFPALDWSQTVHVATGDYTLTGTGMYSAFPAYVVEPITVATGMIHVFDPTSIQVGGRVLVNGQDPLGCANTVTVGIVTSTSLTTGKSSNAAIVCDSGGRAHFSTSLVPDHYRLSISNAWANIDLSSGNITADQQIVFDDLDVK